mgnify:CR=1 FL=1
MSAKNKLYYIVLFFYALLTNAQKLQIPSSTNHIKNVEFILDQEKSFGRDTTALKKFLQPLQNISNYKVLYDGLLANGYSDFYDSVNESSNKYYLRSIKKAKNSKNSSLQIWAQLNYISYLYHYRDYINLTPILLEVIAAIETLPKDQIISADESFKKIGWIMHTYGDYNTSIRYLEAAEKTAAKNTSEYAAIINAIGLNNFYLGNDKQATIYLNKTANLAIQIHDEVRYAKALGDLALISRKKGDLKTASELLEKDIQISEKNKSDQNTMYASILLAEVFLENKNIQGAKEALNRAEKIATAKTFFKKNELQIINLRLEILKLEHSTENELILRRRMNELENSLKDKDGELAVNKVNWLLEKAKYEQHLDKAQEQIEYECTLKNFYIVIFTMISCIALLVFIYFKKRYINRYLRYEQQVAHLESEKLKMEQKLNEVQDNLDSQIDYLKEKKKQIQNLKISIESIKQSSSYYIEKEKGKLNALLQSQLMTEKNWNAFKKEFQKEYPEFYLLLQEDFPEISDSNKKILLLQKLNFTNNETAELLGITSDDVKKSKLELKKKLGEKYNLLFDRFTA